ncbi:MAG: hypothetical protein ACLQU4_17395 [Limisphaerales bacterium]
MGAFIVNYQVRTDSLAAVRDALEKMVTERAYVSPAKDGWVTVYDEESDSQNGAVLQRIASGLSRALKTDVLGFMVHDSDIAMYWLYQSGDLLDEFNSAPDYLGNAVDDATRDRLRGKAELLLPLCVAGTTTEQIGAAIHPTEEPVFAEDYLAKLAPLLGIDETRINLGFEYFTNEGSDILDDASEFELLGQDEG